jgi:large subunit ribosomal protein L3
MLNGLLGKKIGMSQIFDDNRKSIPVTVIDVGGWFVTQIKTQENDGYVALQIGLPREKYQGKGFSSSWLKEKKKYFLYLNEVSLDDVSGYAVGQRLSLKDFKVDSGNKVDVAGTSRGLGFQGVIKRWGFSGGPGGHGSTFHRKPGSIGNMCSQGNVIKGKKLPGQCGNKRITVKNLKVVKVDEQANCLFVKGAVPGKKNSLLFLYSKQV